MSLCVLGWGGGQDLYLISELWASCTGCLQPILIDWCLTGGLNSESRPVNKYLESTFLGGQGASLQRGHSERIREHPGKRAWASDPVSLLPLRRTTTGPLAAPPASCATATPRALCPESVTLRRASVHASQASLAASVIAVTTPLPRSPPTAVKVGLSRWVGGPPCCMPGSSIPGGARSRDGLQT